MIDTCGLDKVLKRSSEQNKIKIEKSNIERKDNRFLITRYLDYCECAV